MPVESRLSDILDRRSVGDLPEFCERLLCYIEQGVSMLMRSYALEPFFVRRRKARKPAAHLSVSKIVVCAALPHVDVSFVGRSRRAAGFTLVELMIALVVTVILVIVAIPSFNSLILSNKLTTTANDMVAAINSARIEAVKRNATTQFCANTTTANTTDILGTACGTQTGAVYLLPAPASTAALQVLAAVGGLTTPLQLGGGTSVALRFNGQGLAQQAGQTTLFGAQVMDIFRQPLRQEPVRNHEQPHSFCSRDTREQHCCA
jgi:Tfp pilus assembly protein FimT